MLENFVQIKLSKWLSMQNNFDFEKAFSFILNIY